MSRNFAFPGRSPVHATQCAAATSHPMGTATALNILRDGGNAVDAALAASATLGIVEPQMTGIGGDCFAIVAEPDGTLHGLNGSGRSPAATSLDRLLDEGLSQVPVQSPHSVTVPGAVKAWETLHGRFGRMDFTRLFADAIRLAEEGFPVAPRVASDWQSNVALLAANKGASAHFLFDGKAPDSGHKVAVPALAGTLRKIATKGAAAFYEGEIADEIVHTLGALGGVMTHDDLASVTADWVTPISTRYGDHLLHEIPPNGQGLAALIMAGLLNKIGVPENPHSVERAHLEIECGRIAYAARDAYISDPSSMEHSIETLISDKHLDQLVALYDPGKRNEELSLPDPAGSDTVYLSVVDADGMAVSFINSLFGGFGSGIVTENSAITLHNRGCGFNLKRGHGNAIGPSKRPLHTIIPAMLTKNGTVTHSFGVMGGPYQAMGHGHVVPNLLSYGMDPQLALDDPRIFWEADGTIALEDTIPQEVKSGLTALGHKCAGGALHGGGQVIQIDHENSLLIAGSDPRKDGHAAGF